MANPWEGSEYDDFVWNLYRSPENAGGVAGSGWDGRVKMGWQFLKFYMSQDNAGGLAGSRWGGRV